MSSEAIDDLKSQSAFVRGFIDDIHVMISALESSVESQSAFVRGFIDDRSTASRKRRSWPVSIRVRARLHR